MVHSMGQLNMEEICNSIEEMRSNKMWMEERLVELKQKYPDQFIAIYKQEVVGSDTDYKALINSLRKKYENIDLIVIEFIAGDDYYLIL